MATGLRGFLVSGALLAMSWLPLRAVHAFGAAFGWCAWLLRSGRRRIAEANIAYCFPELDAAARTRLVRANLVETGKAMFELAPLWLWHPARITRLLREVHGLEALHESLAQSRGVIVVAPHHGAWEFTGIALSREVPMTSMFAPGRLGIDALVRVARERTGAALVPADRRGVAALTECLRNGGVAGILPDQDPRIGGGIFAPFFGRPAMTMTLASKLAIRTGARAFLVWSERLPRAGGFVLHCEAMPAEVASEPLETSVTLVNAAIERAVRARPEQYLWTYKRFRTRPEGEPAVYTR